MKTTANISNLKKIVVAIAAAMVLSTGIYASSNPADKRNDEKNSAARLETLMKATEQSVRFVAPAVEESEEVVAAMVELNEMAETTEATVKYVAPAVEEEEYETNGEIATAMQNLDELAAATEKVIAFRAPQADNAFESESAATDVNNVMLADESK